MNTKIDCKKWKKILAGLRQDVTGDFSDFEKFIEARDIDGILSIKKEIREDIEEVLIDWNDALSMIPTDLIFEWDYENCRISERRSILFVFGGKRIFIKKGDFINDIAGSLGLKNNAYKEDLSVVGFTVGDDRLVVGFDDLGKKVYNVESMASILARCN